MDLPNGQRNAGTRVSGGRARVGSGGMGSTACSAGAGKQRRKRSGMPDWAAAFSSSGSTSVGKRATILNTKLVSPPMAEAARGGGKDAQAALWNIEADNANVETES